MTPENAGSRPIRNISQIAEGASNKKVHTKSLKNQPINHTLLLLVQTTIPSKRCNMRSKSITQISVHNINRSFKKKNPALRISNSTTAFG